MNHNFTHAESAYPLQDKVTDEGNLNPAITSDDPLNSSPAVAIKNEANREDELRKLSEDIRQQHWEDALKRCQRLLASGAAPPELHASFGTVLQHMGQHQPALDAFRSALVIGVESPALHDSAGLCCLMLRDFEAAASHFHRALELQDQQAPIYLLHLGMALRELGRVDEAESVLHRALQADSKMMLVHFQLGLCAEAKHNSSETLIHYNNAICMDRSHFPALSCAARLLTSMGRLEEAIEVYRQVLNFYPDEINTLVRIGQILNARGMLQEALVPLQRVIAYNVGHTDAWTALGQVQVGLGDMIAAGRSYECALRAQPNHLAAKLARIALAERQGRDDEVREQAETMLLAFPMQTQLLTLVARLARSDDEKKEALSRLETALQSGVNVFSKDDESYMRFAAGVLCDKLDHKSDAFLHFREANAYQRNIKRYRREHVAEYFARIRERCSKDVLSALPESSRPDEQPIFLIGLPRSGTSLGEQILASHPDVFGAGELRSLNTLLRPSPGSGSTGSGYPNSIHLLDEDAIERLAKEYLDALPAEAKTAKRVTDKMPHNFQYVGLIKKMFPMARIISCTRDPRDIALSCYFQYFAEGNSFSYDLGDFAHYYRQYRQVMEHWKRVGIDVFGLSYERLVTDPELTVRALLKYCGLEWNASCLKFHENQRVVQTASYKQVKEPFHARSVGRWKAYEPFLASLIEELSEWIDEDKKTQSSQELLKESN